MHDRYPPDNFRPHGPDQRQPGASPPRPGLTPPSDPTLRLDETAGSSRGDGLRRLSRLTWRTTQLSAIAAAAFAVLFARSAPAQTASNQTAVKPSMTASPTVTPTPTHTHRAAARKPKHHKAAASVPSSPASAQPSTPPPAPTLAPPSTPPAPAPTPSAVQTTSSGSTGGG